MSSTGFNPLNIMPVRDWIQILILVIAGAGGFFRHEFMITQLTADQAQARIATEAWRVRHEDTVDSRLRQLMREDVGSLQIQELNRRLDRIEATLASIQRQTQR